MKNAQVQGIISLFLLFFTVCFFSGSCELNRVKNLNWRSIVPGLICQFFLMPFIGWMFVKICQPEPIIGVFVLIITSSPGGAFSNWWCSLFNADLTLSVLLTTCSSLACIGMLPLNLLIYVKSTYGTSISIDWSRLITTIVVIILAVISGLLFRYWKRTEDWVPVWLTRLGTVAGIALILHSSLVTSGSTDAPLLGNPWSFYVCLLLPGGVAFILGLAVASLPFLRLPKPTRVAIAVETCFQNVGIALSAALTIFTGTDSAWGVRASLLYGVSLAFWLAVSLVACWKAGWTLAPASDPIWKVISSSYQNNFDVDEELQEVGARGDSTTVLVEGAQSSGNLSAENLPMTTVDTSDVDVRAEKIGAVLAEEDSNASETAVGHNSPRAGGWSSVTPSSAIGSPSGAPLLPRPIPNEPDSLGESPIAIRSDAL